MFTIRPKADIVSDAQGRGIPICPDCGWPTKGHHLESCSCLARCASCQALWRRSVLTDSRCPNCRYADRLPRSTGSLGQDWFAEKE